MLLAILNKSWQQHPTRHQLYGHLPPITKTIQVRRTRHAGHCWRSRDELIRDVLLWIPTHGRAKAGRPARTYIQQLCEDTGCCPEDLPRAMNDREEWRERVRDIRATSAIWWWWLFVYIKNQVRNYSTPQPWIECNRRSILSEIRILVATAKELSQPYYLHLARSGDIKRTNGFMSFSTALAKHKQPRSRFDLGSPFPFLTAITVTQRVSKTPFTSRPLDQLIE